jgi:hypothetical protein
VLPRIARTSTVLSKPPHYPLPLLPRLLPLPHLRPSPGCLIEPAHLRSERFYRPPKIRRIIHPSGRGGPPRVSEVRMRPSRQLQLSRLGVGGSGENLVEDVEGALGGVVGDDAGLL